MRIAEAELFHRALDRDDLVRDEVHGERVVRRAEPVLELDRRGALRFHPSKTPAEYLREAQLDAAGQSGLAELVWALYRHLFGGVPCAADDWVAFDHAAESLSFHVAPA